jgi:translation initiation factor IF-3
VIILGSYFNNSKVLRKGPRKQARVDTTRINNAIRADEVRVISGDGENIGVMKTLDAIAKAKEMGLDLIEISPNAKPPITKIMDYGKYQYLENKKRRETRTKAHVTETKNVQVKIGTGEHDLELKAKKASEWLKEGHRIKFDLYLRGRAKYLEKSFLDERMHRFLKLLTEEYKIAEPSSKSPKGLTMVIERGKQKKDEDKQVIQKEDKGDQERQADSS